jgi:hypothetical protein
VADKRIAYFAAFILLAICSCERVANDELPDFTAKEYPLATEYCVTVREPGKPEKTQRKPYHGSETVLDVMAPFHREYGGLERFDVWLVRRGAASREQLLKVDWAGITQRGETSTNFLLSGGDRLILQARRPQDNREKSN